MMKEVRGLVKEQKKIDFINDCNAIVDYEEIGARTNEQSTGNHQNTTTIGKMRCDERRKRWHSITKI